MHHTKNPICHNQIFESNVLLHYVTPRPVTLGNCSRPGLLRHPEDMLAALRLNSSPLACVSCSHAGIYPRGLDVSVFKEFCLTSWRLGLSKDWRSLRHIHTVLISCFRAWASLSLHCCCFIVHIGTASVRLFPKVQAYVIIRRNASFMACMRAPIMGFQNWLLHAFCNSIPRTWEVVVFHKIEKEQKIRCIVQ